MQDRPTAPELLDALAAMLFTEVREWVPRERRFQVLVAANVCATATRYVALRSWIFARRGRDDTARRALTALRAARAETV